MTKNFEIRNSTAEFLTFVATGKEDGIQVLYKNETIWATQKAMAELFGVTVPNISYHFKRIFASGELDAQTVIKEILITAQSGVRGVSEEKIRYYNLDAILSLGYRVNSVQATAFRKWATSVLKQYMIKGYAVNQNAVS